jgi:hypothetical protein
MKITAILVLLACLSPVALADDLATPSPTPVYIHPFTRRAAVRRAEQIDRRRIRQAETESRSQTRASAQASRHSASASLAQAREAARAREQAEREVAIQNRVEAARANSQPTSDLMSRMGFSEKEIAMQKAREQSAKSGAKEADPPGAQTQFQQPSQSVSGTGIPEHHPSPSNATAVDAAQKPGSASAAADSH